MEITWLGHSCFRLKSRDTTVIMDPPAAESGYATSKQAANIVTVSHEHPAHNAVENCAGAPRVIRGPGEYEVAGVLIEGVRTFHDAEQGRNLGTNTAYVVEIEELRICHLGDLGHIPSAEQTEELSNIDILLTPVGGGSTIDAAAAAEVISLLEPKIVIPMHYRTEQGGDGLAPLDPFLKQMSLTETPPQPRLVVTRSNLPLETQVVVLDARK